MPKSPEEMTSAMIANMKEKTGKTMPEWLIIAARSKLARHGELVKHLKSDHAMTHGFANLVAHVHLQAAQGGPAGGEDLIAAQYAGAKADLRPIYESLIAAATRLGPDVEVSPKKTCVSLRRNKQFALIQPSTKTRVDLGLNLKGVKPAGRLEPSGSFSAMCSHRVRLESLRDVDAEVQGWLQAAYEVS